MAYYSNKNDNMIDHIHTSTHLHVHTSKFSWFVFLTWFLLTLFDSNWPTPNTIPDDILHKCQEFLEKQIWNSLTANKEKTEILHHNCWSTTVCTGSQPFFKSYMIFILVNRMIYQFHKSHAGTLRGRNKNANNKFLVVFRHNVIC
jgi:hypothetical protein